VSSKCAALMVAAGLMILVASGAQADSPRIAKIQAALDAWLADRSSAEKVTGVAAYISFGDTGPAIDAFAGKVGNGPQDAPVRRGTLFQMGSTAKSFTAAPFSQFAPTMLARVAEVIVPSRLPAVVKMVIGEASKASAVARTASRLRASAARATARKICSLVWK
jgi:hypothetical protein